MARAGGWYAAGVLTVVLALAGCGTESPASPPTGIDQLVIPTPSPDPGDFVRGIDNPWLPLKPGRTWRYQVSGTQTGTLVITVENTTYEIAGVATTPVSRTEPTGHQLVDYYAQDRAGNVWWFGREGIWQAGQDGAEAGLAMPAHPREGDGWREAYGAGRVDVRMTVVTLDQTAIVPAARYTGLLGIDVTDALPPGTNRRVFYARGIGPVEELSIQGPIYDAELEQKP